MDQLTETHAKQPSRLYDDSTDWPRPFDGNIRLATKFLLAEYETIRSFKEQSEISTDRRLDILLSLVAILGAALGFFSQQIARSDFLIVALLVIVSLIIVSLSTLRQVLSRDVITADYTRALNRIRHFFAVENELTAGIRPYILMNTDFNSPAYGKHSKSRETVVIINGLLFAALAEVIRFIFFPEASLELPVTLGLVLGTFVFVYLVLTFIVSRFVYWRWQRLAAKKIKEREEVAHHLPPLNTLQHK